MEAIGISNGVHFARRRKSKRRTKRVLILDIDATLVYQARHHELEEAEDERMARLWSLERGRFEEVRSGDVGTRNNWFDIFYTPLIVDPLLRFASPGEAIETHVIPWLNCIEERENRIEVFPNMTHALCAIVDVWGALNDGDLEIWAHTDMPAPLACMRLLKAGLLPYFTGIIGMEPHCPEHLMDVPTLAQSARYIQGFIDSIYRFLPDRIRFVAELEQHMAKPCAAGPLALLNECDLDPDLRIVDVDDKWSKGGQVAKTLQNSYPSTKFLLSIIEHSEPLLGQSPSDFRAIQRSGDLLDALADYL